MEDNDGFDAKKYFDTPDNMFDTHGKINPVMDRRFWEEWIL